jgi:hypothetical protein
MTRTLAKIFFPIVLTGVTLVSLLATGAESYPQTDPPLPQLIEPSQTEEPSVYGVRR